MKIGQTNLRKINTNTEFYVKNPKGKNHGEREKDSTIMAITMVILLVLGFLGSIDHPLLRWKGSTIYTSSVYWIRLQSPTLFKYLTAYPWGDWAEHSDLNWFGESSSLFGSLHPVVDVVDLISSYNYRVW